jgi:mannose-binding lectin 1
VQVALPTGNNFGITAATPENPDSFEIFKFVVQPSASGTNAAPPAQPQANQQPNVNQGQARPVDPRSINSDQLVDLSSRIQSLNDATNSIAHDVRSLSSKAESRHIELQKMATKEQVANLDARLQKIEQLLQNIQRDLEGKDYRDRFNQLHETLRSSHMSLTENLQGTLLNGKHPMRIPSIKRRTFLCE